MKTTRKKRTWFMIATLVIAISLVATATNFHNSTNTISIMTDEELVMESWMSDPTYLENIITDDPLVLEPWMSAPNYLEDQFIEDEPMEMENWMSETDYLN